MLTITTADVWSSHASTQSGRNRSSRRPQMRAARIEIVLTNHPTELAGAVEDEIGRSIADYSLLIFPVDRALRPPSRVQWVRPDQTGRFLVRGLPPGSYLAIAPDEVEDSAWNDEEYLTRFESNATTVTLTDGEAKTIRIPR